MPIESGGPATAPLTDAQVAALREAAEKATPGPWTAENRHSDFGPCYNTVRHASGWITDQDGIDKYADARYIAEVSPDVMLALLAERDALKAEVGDARRTSQFHKDNHLAAEAALSALRARETLLRESLCLLPRYRSAGYGAMVESDRGGYVSVADVDAALSTPAVHGASEAER